MERKKAVEKLKSILKDWDGCEINTRAASQILKRIQNEIGMLPPEIPEKCAEVRYEWGKPKHTTEKL